MQRFGGPLSAGPAMTAMAASIRHSASQTGRNLLGGTSKLGSLFKEELFDRATAPEGDASPLPRSLLVFAHPDDETVALGARLGRFGAAHFVHVTDGAPRNEQDSRWHGFASWRDYRAARGEEFRNLLAAAGIARATHECLEIPDQGASGELVSLTQRVAGLLERHAPEVLFTHPFEGGHPDHDACAFAVHQAVRLREAHAQGTCLIIEGGFYNAQSGQPGELLRCDEQVLQHAFHLSREECQRKQRLMDCFISQKETLQGFPLEWERFRVAPAYNFRLPPHEPPLLYDRYPWGMTSTRFNQLANEAEEFLHAHR